jgi:uncharacterized cupin superfamily protein
MRGGGRGNIAVMQRINIAEPEFTFDAEDPPGFRAGMMRFGPQLGAEQTGASVYELPPGEALCPYHYEHGEEEWALVLSGTPSVRTPQGTTELQPMDVLFFPRGPDGAHQLRNDSAEPARVLMWSTVVVPTVSVYPDSGKIGVWTAGKTDDLLVERSSAVPYFHGEA